MSATIINAIIISMAVWSVIMKKTIFIWCAVNIGFAVCRYSVIYYYKKCFNPSHMRLWKAGTYISFAVAGLLFGSSIHYLTRSVGLEYVIFIYFICGGMMVGSAGSYHNNLGIYFTYAASVFLFPTFYLKYMDFSLVTPLMSLGVVCFIVISVMAMRMSRDLRDSLLLRYDNNQLILVLEKEKGIVEKLNLEFMEKNMELNELSLSDPLTGLRNRRYLFEIIMPEIEAFRRNCVRGMKEEDNRHINTLKGYGLIIADIDHFKQVNDSFGHDSGDMVLAQFANRIRESVRHDDAVIRLGGEEFVVVLKHVEEKNALDITQKIHRCISASPFTLKENRTADLTCSIGFIFYPFHDLTLWNTAFEKMMSIADSALYYAKANGRNLAVKAEPGNPEFEFTRI
jgi:diguanylate cyclase (GGDEF)-like protein